MGKSSNPPPDFKGEAQQQAKIGQANSAAQTAANRPNQNTGIATSSWTQGPNGSWNQNVGLNGPLGGVLGSLQSQAAQANGKPLDFSGMPQVGTGDSARSQAINASYGQAASRLDPRFSQEQEQLQNQLSNQGLDPNSQAYRNAMGNFGREKNDAYSSAMNSAIGQGTQAGQAAFGQNLAARQQAIQEALTGRQAPLQQLGTLQGLEQMPGFSGAGMAQAPDLLGAANAQGNFQIGNAQAQNQSAGSALGGLGALAGSLAMFL